jgi:hypothetical protein
MCALDVIILTEAQSMGVDSDALTYMHAGQIRSKRQSLANFLQSALADAEFQLQINYPPPLGSSALRWTEELQDRVS